MLGIGSAVLCAAHLALMAKAASAPRFHLEEATIADVHRAIRAKEITAEQLVQSISSASRLITAPALKAKSIRQPASCSAK
jgi:Spy/CpxP family protein refolding chaperone